MIESTNGYCNKEQKGHENHKEVKCMFVKVIQCRCRWSSCGETILSRHVVYVVYHPHTKLEGTKPVQWTYTTYQENILKERDILQELSTTNDARTIYMTRYVDFFEDDRSFYLVIEEGGSD
eukprot:873911_1